MKRKVFSIRPLKLDLNEIKESMRLAEKYFDTSNDAEQAPINLENATWIRKTVPKCFNVIKYGDELIGFSLVYPCKREIMDKFVSKKINEAELFGMLKESELNRKPETIYFCSVFVKPEFRGRGLALKSLTKSIKSIFNLKSKPPLFYWAYSQEGDALSKKLATLLNLPLYKRKN